MVNMANLKGNLGLKSSSLAPTACKLSTQYMVLDHMTNHYNKISQAKSAIDNKPPKSMTTSQKMRDRKTRARALSPHHNRPTSSMSHTHGQTYHDDVHDYQDFLNEEPEDEEGRLVQSIMKTTLAKKSNGSNEATFNSKTQTFSQSTETMVRQENGPMAGGEHQRTTWQRPMSARSGLSATSSINGTQRVPITSHDPKKITYNGDLLDKRSYCFTEPDRPFTPRTLKSSHESRLKSSKCYNAPKPKSGKPSDMETSAPEQGNDRESRPRPHPRPQPRQRNRSGQSDLFGETMPTNQLSESMLMDITLQSRDGRHAQEGKRDVPPLAISMDTDHFKWLQEQASKAQVRARHSSKIKPGPRADVTTDGMQEGDEESPLNLSHSIRLETLKKEEEQKYLAFVKEVTDDVLTRGISTDKVLHRVFESHIERRKDDLDETRMRAMIKDLKKDLGLRDMSVERKESHTVNFTTNTDKDKLSTTHSLERDQDGQSVHSESRDTLSSKPEVNYHNGLTTTGTSNMAMTMESTSTMQFGQTGDLFSTIHSEQQDRDNLSDGEVVEMSDKENDENELTATQVLKEYQMNLTAKEASGDGNGEVSSSEVGIDKGNGGSGGGLLKPGSRDERPATGERRADQDSSTIENGRTTTATDFSSAANGSTTTVTSNSHGNHVSSQDSSTLNGSLPRSRLRNRRRERTTKSSTTTASVDSGSAKEEPSSNSVLKSSTSVETGSERDNMSESGQEMYSKPAARTRARPDHNNKHSEESEPRESQGEEFKSTDRSDGSAIGEDYAGDYEDDYDEGSLGNDTHRTSDDDF